MQRVIVSGRFTMKELVAAIGRAFAACFGMKHGILVNSHSSANLVAVAAVFCGKDQPLQRGDEATVPAMSWATTHDSAQQHGLKPRAVDVGPDGFAQGRHG